MSKPVRLTPADRLRADKAAGRDILAERATRDGYSWTVVRLPTVYGPGQKPDGLFDQLIKRAEGGSLLGRLDWPGRTSIVHVDDVAAAMIELAGRPEAAGEVFCIASDESLTVGELARGIGEAIGRPVRPIGIPVPLVALARLDRVESRGRSDGPRFRPARVLAPEPDHQRRILVRHHEVPPRLHQAAEEAERRTCDAPKSG